jgi:two-component system, sensor histidine kinase and response regulator
LNEMTHSHDLRLVALSIAIAILASYAALDLAGRVTAAQGRSRGLWLLGGAFAMGTGIWSMHYVGMLAFRLPFPVLYHVPTVLASLLLAVCASAVALFVVSGETLSLGRACAGSVAMGGAIAAMHYTGMAAMRMPAGVRYQPVLFTLSVALAIVISLVALALAFRFRAGGTGVWAWAKLGSALLMGAAIPAMHYTGMAAAQFSPAIVPASLTYAVSISALGLSAVVASSFLVLSLAIGTSILDRRLAGNAIAHSQLQASEERLQQVLAASTVVIYAMSVKGDSYTPNWVSDNVARITGFDVREALEPDWWSKHVHPDDWPRVLSHFPALFRDGRRTFEYRFQHQDGSYHWIHDEARLVDGVGGRPTEIFGAWIDLTERKAMEEAVRTARDVAERAVQTRTAFLANMSHEIRTPMNAVLGLTELVLDTELTPEQQRSLRLVQSAGESLLALLNDVLDLSKIEAEHLTLESISFDVRYLLESTASLLAVRVGDKPVELIVDVGADVRHMVSGDPTRLRQVLANLVGNAIKFTHQGEVVLSARFEALPDHRALVRFAVRDTGIGIAPDKLETIFEEFSQADTSMTRQYGGTGLGLTIARRLVALMGGELTVTSESGHGSEFAFALAMPCAQEAAMMIDTVGTLTGQRVLVVDDNATNRRIIREMLGSENTIVDEVSGANDALEALRQARAQEKPYGLVIVDAHMPVRDGFELASVIRSDPTVLNPRLLMLTSAGQPGDGERCRRLGIEGYLMKPPSRCDLLTSAAALLGTSGQTPPGDLVTRHSIAEGRRELKILLAEDNPVNQEVARAMLRKRGHQVDVVANGYDAVDAVRGTRYDLVLMDIQMPQLDGFAATAAIRELPGGAGLPIFALTAHAMSGERERCIARGMNGYLSKPFKGHELYALVDGVCPSTASSAGPTPMLAEVSAPASPAAFNSAEFRRTMRDVGAEDAVDAVLDLFAEHAPGRLAALNGAMASGQGEEIARAAHAFKSPAGAIGARGLESLLLDMEVAGIAGAIDQARTAFDRVRPEVESVLQHLRRERGKEGR